MLNSKSHSSEAFTFVRNNSVTINSKWSTETNSHENRQTSCWLRRDRQNAVNPRGKSVLAPINKYSAQTPELFPV